MLHHRVVNFDTKEQFNISIFEDDMIETVRQQIGIALDTHPDRLLILVGVKLPKDYYVKDPRRWEALFHRLSFNGQPIKKEQFQEYQKQYRVPALSIPFESYNLLDWLDVPESLAKLHNAAEDFTEYRILGVDEVRSYILPLVVKDQFSSKIPATLHPIAKQKSLLYSFYDPSIIVEFLVRPFAEEDEMVKLVYYPFLQQNTPPRLSEEIVNVVTKNSKLLNDLLNLEVVEEESFSIKRSRYIIPFVTTDLGSAVHTRFEQMFYGLTVSPEVPYIQFYTAENETNRHKFYSEDQKNKVPFISIPVLRSWLTGTKPYHRRRPTLMLYRGTSKENFDKISITATEITLSTYRDRKNKETANQLKKELHDWLIQFDSILGFVEPDDIKINRWVLDDMAISIKYKKAVEDDLDMRRFNCVSSFFNMYDKKDTFQLLRTDHSTDGITAVEVKLIRLKTQNGFLSLQEVQNELNVSADQAGKLIRQIEDKLEENPSLETRAFRGYPALHIESDFITFSSVTNLPLAIKYANMLRFVLSTHKSDKLDEICPKRMETIEVKSLEPTFDSNIVSEYADLFADLEEDIPEKVETETVKTQPTPRKKKDTMYSYFATRAREFDAKTFGSIIFPKACEHHRQPIILSEADLERLKDTPYDATTYLSEYEVMKLEEPKGNVICPVYWCMKDNIPLTEAQLVNEDGVLKCPKCKGKIWEEPDNIDVREFTVRKRNKNIKFPGRTKDGNFPCCFETNQLKKTLKPKVKEDDKYYVLSEQATVLDEYRFAFLPDSLIKSLNIEETYGLIVQSGRRIPSGISGYFRVGIGHAIDTLPTLLGPNTVKIKIKSPIESISTILKCSFLSTWSHTSDTHVEQIANLLKDISPFQNDDTLRKNLSKIISGIQDAYEKKELSPIHELEYATLSLQCDVFRIYTDTNTMGCMYSSVMNRPKNRAIIILQNQQNIDILAMVHVVNRTFVYKANIYDKPFNKKTQVEVERLRNLSCRTEIPSYSDALSAMPDILAATDSESYSVILDPFGRGQAFYVESKVILPFKPSPLPDISQPKISGYKDILNLPKYDDVRKYLILAEGYSKGYGWREDTFDSSERKVEIVTKSGLPIPIQAEVSESGENTEVTETVRTFGETDLVFGNPSTELEKVYRDINYSSEVFEFLLFQLARDLDSDDYAQLRDALEFENQKLTNTFLEKWFTKTTMFVDIDNPANFISKIRQPCGQFTKGSCKGNLCGWDGKVCKTKIKNTIKKDELFQRLLNVLTKNLKIRAAVLDNRITPFFSTILYLELPHELIVTDSELNAITV